MTPLDAGTETEQVLLRKVLRSLDSRQMKLTLMPTEKCNFRCTYCYEDFLLGRMPRRVVEGVKALLTSRAPDLATLHLSWFGGEPLLAPTIIAEICAHAQALAAEHPGLRYSSSMTTNASRLDGPLFEQLVELGVRGYQISLDGYGEDHDRTRQRQDGSGSFDAIWANLLRTREAKGDFSIMLRLHIAPDRVEETERLIDALNDAFGGDRRYRVFFKAITRLGGPNNQAIAPASWAWQRETIARLTSRLKGSEAKRTDPVGSAYMCYAAEPNSLVIRSNGQLARCTVAFADQRNQIGQLNPDGTLDLDEERSRVWFQGLETLDPKMLHCPLAAMARPASAGRPPKLA